MLAGMVKRPREGRVQPLRAFMRAR